MVWCLTAFGSTISYGLIDGGLAGLVCMFVVASVGMGTVVLSLAEMASMWGKYTRQVFFAGTQEVDIIPRAPTSGGQYHWASEFAPPDIQRFLSFMTGA